MIPITWTEEAKIPNLPELLDRVRKQGGSIVEFQRVWSVIFFCHSGPIYRWVGSKPGRFFQSLSEALFCFLAGWWSPAGIIWTLPAVINNLCGGVDVTLLYAEPPPLPGALLDNATLAAYGRYAMARQRQGILTLVSTFLVVGSLIYLGWRW